MAVEAFFLPATGGPRFCLFHPAPGPVRRGAVVYLHPFAEEMNKARRMAAIGARALAAAGFDVLQIDLYGCGDSAGDFGDASWSAWIDDAAQAARWISDRSPGLPFWYWGLRAGGLLAGAAVRAGSFDGRPGLLLWNPVISGSQQLQQFLRLKVAGSMLAGDGRDVLAETRNELKLGQPAEIAGYRLSPRMAEELERADLAPHPAVREVLWIETSPREEPTLSRAASMACEQWRSAGGRIEARAVEGPAFWQTTEIEVAPALIAATLAGLETET